ncbi:MAG: hypothetical protein IPO91_21235 [Chloroflexi bacterium]|nr:hypothetical protein [Chloroflexota bacterium]
MRPIDYLAQTEIAQQRREATAQHERALLIKEALAGTRGHIAFYQPLLINVGKRIERFGAGLQARYSVGLEISHSGTLARDTAC